jgi:hypothetical protein
MVEKFANAAVSTLASGINATDLSLTLGTGDGAEFPTMGADDTFRILIDDELILVRHRTGDVLSWDSTADRGIEGSAAASHLAAAEVLLVFTDESIRSLLPVGTVWTLKGDLLVATAAGLAQVLPVGADGEFLKADSGEATGLVYASVPNPAHIDTTGQTADDHHDEIHPLDSHSGEWEPGDAQITHLFQSAHLAAQASRNSTSFSDLTGMAFDVEVNAFYDLELIIHEIAPTTDDLKIQFTVPTGTTIKGVDVGMHDSAPTASQVSANYKNQDATATIILSGIGGTEVVHILRLFVDSGGTAGTCQLQGALNANTGPGTFEVGTRLKAEKLE